MNIPVCVMVFTYFFFKISHVAQDFDRSVLTTGNDLVPTSCASTLVCIEQDQLGVIILY